MKKPSSLLGDYSYSTYYSKIELGSIYHIKNQNNKLVQYVLANKDGENTGLFCEQLYDLAMISHKPLAPEAMTKFIARSNQIIMLLAK